jgi:hypothetical protein
MSISFPRTTILSATDFADQTFQLMSRQELSRQVSGRTIGKDLGPALWMATYTTKPMQNDDALAYEAALDSLDGVVQTFEAYDLRRPYPRSDPTGATYNNGVLASVNANNKALALSGLVAGQVVSVGDYLSFTYGSSRALHRVAEGVTANGSGVTAQFEVRPHIRSGYSVSAAVTLKTPRGVFMLVPGSMSVKANGGMYSVVSFQAVQALL